MPQLSADDVRIQLDSFIPTYLPGLAAHYHYEGEDFGGLTPVVCLETANVIRPRKTLDAKLRTEFFINLHIYSLVKNSTGTWSAQQAQKECDDLEAKVGDMLEAKPRLDGYWNILTYSDQQSGTTTAPLMDVGGNDYRRVTVHLKASLWPSGA